MRKARVIALTNRNFSKPNMPEPPVRESRTTALITPVGPSRVSRDEHGVVES
jgi:hypothetical protein